MLEKKEETTCLFSEEHVKLIKEQYDDWFNRNQLYSTEEAMVREDLL